MGATFLRNNLNKRSICLDLKRAEGRALVLRLAERFDVVAENFRPGTVARLGLGYEDIAAVNPRAIYVSVSGFGNTAGTPYRDWPAFAAIVEAMSGIYEAKRVAGHPPTVIPVGALGDLSASMFTTVAILAALRQRDATGTGQYVDVAMFDSVVAMTDIVMNFWSLGVPQGQLPPVLVDAFRANDGWFVLQTGRGHQFARLAELIGRPGWIDDPRFASPDGWLTHLEEVIRPAIEKWAADKTRLDACNALGAAGIAAGPCLRDDEVVTDPHLAARGMVVEMARPDDVAQPVLIPGNPVKLSAAPEQPDRRVPWLGEHTDEVLSAELGMTAAQLAAYRDDGVIA